MTKNDKITKSFKIEEETYKAIKILAIELDLDDDKKLTPEILGKVLDHIILKKLPKIEK